MTTTATRTLAGTLTLTILVTGGQTAVAEETTGTEPRGLTAGGRSLSQVLHVDPVADLRAPAESARFFARAGIGQPATKATARGRRGRVGRAAAIGAGVGAAIGFLPGSSWCFNEGGGCGTLITRFAGLGALAGAGVGAAIGAIGGR